VALPQVFQDALSWLPEVIQMTVGLYCGWQAISDFRRDKPRIAVVGAVLGLIVVVQVIAMSALKISYFLKEGQWP
jgi:hypothetical protein